MRRGVAVPLAFSLVAAGGGAGWMANERLGDTQSASAVTAANERATAMERRAEAAENKAAAAARAKADAAAARVAIAGRIGGCTITSVADHHKPPGPEWKRFITRVDIGLRLAQTTDGANAIKKYKNNRTVVGWGPIAVSATVVGDKAKGINEAGDVAATPNAFDYDNLTPMSGIDASIARPIGTQVLISVDFESVTEDGDGTLITTGTTPCGELVLKNVDGVRQYILDRQAPGTPAQLSTSKL
jgi:hypothetical protein